MRPVHFTDSSRRPARPARLTLGALVLLVALALGVPGGAAAGHAFELSAHSPQDCGPGNGSLRLCLQGSIDLSLGQSDLFWANATGATVPLKFVWNVVGTITLANATSESMRFTPHADGLFSVNVTATDADDNQSGASLLLDVSGPSPVSVQVGYSQNNSEEAVTFSASVSGGTGPYTYVWTMSGTDSFHGTGPNLTIQGLDPGRYTVTVQVTDSQGFVGTSTLPIILQPPTSSSNSVPLVDVELALVVGLGVAVAVVLLVVIRRRSPPSPPGQR
ncbi:MAG: PKD domain-containing protein [Thermoplasmata archaeon]|nr:PKD domain-containing protein [Thermoplasmata archaeon]